MQNPYTLYVKNNNISRLWRKWNEVEQSLFKNRASCIRSSFSLFGTSIAKQEFKMVSLTQVFMKSLHLYSVPWRVLYWGFLGWVFFFSMPVTAMNQSKWKFQSCNDKTRPKWETEEKIQLKMVTPIFRSHWISRLLLGP